MDARVLRCLRSIGKMSFRSPQYRSLLSLQPTLPVHLAECGVSNSASCRCNPGNHAASPSQDVDFWPHSWGQSASLPPPSSSIAILSYYNALAPEEEMLLFGCCIAYSSFSGPLNLQNSCLRDSCRMPANKPQLKVNHYVAFGLVARRFLILTAKPTTSHLLTLRVLSLDTRRLDHCTRVRFPSLDMTSTNSQISVPAMRLFGSSLEVQTFG